MPKWHKTIENNTPKWHNMVANANDTSSILEILERLNKIKSKATIIIKSTIPIGFTRRVGEIFPQLKIIFHPSF